MSVAAIVVNFNAGAGLADCLAALLASTDTDAIYLADNASTDHSLEALTAALREEPRLALIRNGENLGYARAVNLCAAQAVHDYLLLVNPDCVITPGMTAALRKALEHDPGAALAAPRVVDSQGIREPASWRRFPRPWNSLMTLSSLGRLEHRWPACAGVSVAADPIQGEPRVAEAVSGACFMVRRQLFMEMGGFDESYGLHCEDLDLMYRVHQAGWHCLYVPAVGARHAQGVSSRSRPYWVHRQKHLGMRRFFDRFQAAEYGWLVRTLVRAGICLRWLLLLPRVWLETAQRRSHPV